MLRMMKPVRDKIEITIIFNTEQKIALPKTVWDLIFRREPSVQSGSTIRSTNNCYSIDDVKKVVTAMKKMLENHKDETITDLQIVAQGKLHGIKVDISSFNMENFCDSLEKINLFTEKFNRAMRA